MRRLLATTFALLPVLLPALAQAATPDAGGYSTEVKVQYVLGCMAANQQDPYILHRCSCAIDTIASVLPYDTYETAETAMRMETVPGAQAAAIRAVPMSKDAVEQMRRAQAQANQQCF